MKDDELQFREFIMKIMGMNEEEFNQWCAEQNRRDRHLNFARAILRGEFAGFPTARFKQWLQGWNNADADIK
jgi:hypothetical protein